MSNIQVWVREILADLRAAGEPLIGHIDTCDRLSVRGWALDRSDPLRPVRLAILLDGRLVDRITADGYRADLAAAGHGDGRCAFACPFVVPLDGATEHKVEVRRSSDGALIDLVLLPAAAGETGTRGASAETHSPARKASKRLRSKGGSDRIRQFSRLARFWVPAIAG